MHIRLKTILVSSVLIGGLAATPALYAHESSGSKRPMMGQGGMMQGGQGGQMGQGGMMNMMGQMNQMMATCNQMMQAMTQQHQQEKPQKPGQTPKKNKG